MVKTWMKMYWCIYSAFTSKWTRSSQGRDGSCGQIVCTYNFIQIYFPQKAKFSKCFLNKQIWNLCRVTRNVFFRKRTFIPESIPGWNLNKEYIHCYSLYSVSFRNMVPKSHLCPFAYWEIEFSFSPQGKPDFSQGLKSILLQEPILVHKKT